MAEVLVVGAGAWGLTLGDLLARKGCSVTIWDRSETILHTLRTRRSRGAPRGLEVHPSVQFSGELKDKARDCSFLVCAVPSYAVRGICEALKPVYNGGGPVFVSCSKGIEEGSLLLPSQIYEDVLGPAASSRFAILAGPSHAEEVCRNVPTSIVSCSGNEALAEEVRNLFFLPTFRVYTASDCMGVEMGGALKNVIAIAAGVCDGLGFGDNTKAALVTRGLAEIARAAEAMGARRETLAGLSGLGDLMVTAGSRHSRNRLFGELLANGRSPNEALAEVGAAVEGYRTSRSAHELSRKIGVEMPLIEAVYQLVHLGTSIQETIRFLLERDPRPENY